jgi:hypothetical protein
LRWTRSVLDQHQEAAIHLPWFFRGSVLALTVKAIGIGAKLTIKENDWVGPKVVLYEPISRDWVGRHVRQNGEPVADHPTTSTLAGERGAGGVSDGPLAGDRAKRPRQHPHTVPTSPARNPRPAQRATPPGANRRRWNRAEGPWGDDRYGHSQAAREAQICLAERERGGTPPCSNPRIKA